jgi:hypothetical protein
LQREQKGRFSTISLAISRWMCGHEPMVLRVLRQQLDTRSSVEVVIEVSIGVETLNYNSRHEVPIALAVIYHHSIALSQVCCSGHFCVSEDERCISES